MCSKNTMPHCSWGADSTQHTHLKWFLVFRSWPLSFQNSKCGVSVLRTTDPFQSFQQLRGILWKARDKSRVVGSRQMADRCHRVGGGQRECWLTCPSLLATSDRQAASSSCSSSPCKGKDEAQPALRGRWWSNRPNAIWRHGMNKGSLFLGPQRSPYESRDEGCCRVGATA